MADLVVDSHQHFWDTNRFSYPWMGREVAPIAKTFMPPDLVPILNEVGVDKTILVQARAALEDTNWFLELAAEHDFIAGVVGWVDLLDPNLPRVLDHLLGHAKFKGIRHQVHDEPDDAWIVRDDVLRGLRELAKRDIPYDLLLRPQHLQHVPRVVDRIANLSLVVDHLAKPSIALGGIDDWARDIALVADIPHIYCKVSGMVTEADWRTWTAADLRPYVQVVIQQFGYDRLMFGSDWPPCLLAATYQEVWEATHTAMGPMNDDDHAKVFGRNAATFYKLAICD